MSLELLLFSYVLLALAVIFGLAWYSSQRQKHFGPSASEDRIFRCRKCGYVYTDDADVDRSRCNQCGTLNDEIRF